MTRRSRGREVALQVLYQVEQNPGVSSRRDSPLHPAASAGGSQALRVYGGLIDGVKEHQARIDAMISQVAENWRLDRMAAIDRNILRLGAYEMLFRPEVPAKVAINEALELAKRYSTAQSSRFVNGILDRVLQCQIQEANPQADPGRTRSPSPRPSQTPWPRASRRMKPNPRKFGRGNFPLAPVMTVPIFTSTRRIPTGFVRPARWLLPRHESAWQHWRSPTTTRSRPSRSPGPRQCDGVLSWSRASS